MSDLFDPSTAFHQEPPRLGNTFHRDPLLGSFLRRVLPAATLAELRPELEAMGELAGGELYRQHLAERRLEPVHTPWDAWGARIDAIELTPLWQRAAQIAARAGLVALAYERRHGASSRLHQFALAYLANPSLDLYGCPLAMSDGAARVLELLADAELRDRALSRLVSRDPAEAWTSGQWMTETTGGSDVGGTETIARLENGRWRLFGRKWFTSAVSSPMALALARPEGNPSGARGLALFYLETRDGSGRPNHLRVARLKDKLGTRKLPTAELLLDGVPARLLGDTSGGVRAIAPMLNVTRTWNAVTAVASMRRGLTLARDFAARRHAFGRRLLDLPLHADTLAGLEAETTAAFHLALRVAQLLGLSETGEASPGEERLLRVLTPLAKLATGKQAVAVLSEVLEACGGAGYVEDTGLPVLLRDAQVLPIWEGTTNVLALDSLRALEGDPSCLEAELERCLANVTAPGLAAPKATARAGLGHALAWFAAGPNEADARRFALTAARSLALPMSCSHAQWALDVEADARPAAAARRFAAQGVDLLSHASEADDAGLLLREEPFLS